MTTYKNKTISRLTILCMLFSSIFFSSIAFAGDKISPMTIDGATTVTTEEAKKLFDQGVLFVDVRRDSDWEVGRVQDAIHLNSKSTLNEANLLKELKKDEPAVFYCNGEKCMRSSKACKQAVSWGFSKVYYYRDGFPAWKKAGLPSE